MYPAFTDLLVTFKYMHIKIEELYNNGQNSNAIYIYTYSNDFLFSHSELTYRNVIFQHLCDVITRASERNHSCRKKCNWFKLELVRHCSESLVQSIGSRIWSLFARVGLNITLNHFLSKGSRIRSLFAPINMKS